MCFVHDYDWRAELVERGSHATESGTSCHECYARIGPGETIHTLWMQEHEECQACENGDCACLKNHDDAGCQCEEPVHGESFDWQCCDNCYKFLQAVEAVEVEAGCHRSEARPALTAMIEEVSGSNSVGREEAMPEARKYFKKAIALFPELKASGYLGKLWKRMFV